MLCLNPAISRSIQRVYDLTLLHEDLTAASALRLVAIWQAADREENKPVASIPTSVPRVPQRAAGDSRPLVPVPRPKIRWERAGPQSGWRLTLELASLLIELLRQRR